MARDATARERDSNSLLGRRSSLRLAGAPAVSVAVAGATGSADAVPSDTIAVAAGETETIEVSGDFRDLPTSIRADSAVSTDSLDVLSRRITGPLSPDASSVLLPHESPVRPLSTPSAFLSLTLPSASLLDPPSASLLDSP